MGCWEDSLKGSVCASEGWGGVIALRGLECGEWVARSEREAGKGRKGLLWAVAVRLGGGSDGAGVGCARS